MQKCANCEKEMIGELSRDKYETWVVVKRKNPIDGLVDINFDFCEHCGVAQIVRKEDD